MKKLIEYINNNKNKVIALDGPSGSGKSTTAKYLEEHFDVLVFHTDDYFLPMERKTRNRLNQPGGNLDYERMEEEVFKHLKDEVIISNFFNCMSNELEKRQPAKKKSIIIVEGVYSLHPRFQKYYDFKVYFDIDREHQYNRIQERSGDFMLERFKKEWIPLEDKYFDELNIKKNVDLYIKNH
ncbi:Uridine kinase [Candidatus Izimaplasma bacterium HR1]|jgi:uridine kinase|uniref:uridine kinase family protein n=1 Tax=Candidatus Izimoplasma sp. HR1 TaxID=1541959 RepID=UPI0004F88A9C|nr:Uridine kinase [Candidatus Izimaplasma bacterium HR1]